MTPRQTAATIGLTAAATLFLRRRLAEAYERRIADLNRQLRAKHQGPGWTPRDSFPEPPS